MTKLSKISKKKALDQCNEYMKMEQDRLNIRDFRVYWRNKTNRVPKDYIILGKIRRNWSGLLNSSVRFIDKLTEVTYKFIIKDSYIYIDEKFTTEDNLHETKYFVGEVIGKNVILDKWMIL